MDLKENKTYLIQNGYFETFDEDYYNSVISMVYTHYTHRMDDGERFYFQCPLSDINTSVDHWSISSNVFKDETDFLKFSVYEANRINTKIDTFFQDLIDASKLKYPERWI